MADSVYYHLERMLPELDELLQRGLFSASEIKDIAKKRRDFEFRIQRRAKLKEDYVSYIQYELELEKLRKLRKKALIRGFSSNGNKIKKSTKWKNSISDRASASRVMLIYERAVTRFKGDLQLWMQYLEYCRSQGTRRMQMVLTKVLRLHPTIPGLWIYAAAWEFEHNANITAARALMQRGLRMCPHSEKLWLEYFQMELVFVLRPTLNNSIPSSNKTESVEEGKPCAARQGASEGEHTIFSMQDELAYKLAWAVYKNAIAANPSNLEFRKRFVEVLQRRCFERLMALCEEILSSLKHDFAKNVDCWDWLARFEFDRTGDMDKAVEVYESALASLPCSHMHELYAKFLKEQLVLKCQKSGENINLLKKSGNAVSEIAKKLLELFERAQKNTMMSPVVTELYASLLLSFGELDSAAKLLSDLVCGDFKSDARLWTMRITLEMKKHADPRSVADLVEQCLGHIQLTEASELWPTVLYFVGRKTLHDKIFDLIIQKLIIAKKDHPCIKLACLLVDWILHSQGINETREFYRRLLSLSSFGVELYKHCIEIECQMVAIGCKDAVQPLRELFQLAVEKHSQNSELWLEYYRQETNLGNTDAAKYIYWRGKKVLNDPSSFLEGYQYHQVTKNG